MWAVSLPRARQPAEQWLEPRRYPVLLHHRLAVTQTQPVDEAVRTGGWHLRRFEAQFERLPLLGVELDQGYAGAKRQPAEATRALDVKRGRRPRVRQVATAAGAGTCPAMSTPTSIHAEVTACASGDVSPYSAMAAFTVASANVWN